MGQTSVNLSILAAVLISTVGAGVAGCSGATDSTPTPAAATGTGGGTTPPAKTPPKGDPADPTPVDPTNDPSLGACTGTPGQLNALTAKKLTLGDDVPLCKFDGNVLLIVNVASHCGNTPQYTPLQALYEKYRAQGFYVLGFPTPQFGGQEFDNESDVTAFCTDEYQITFPMFAIGDVNGPNKQPVYTWIHSQPGGPSAPDGYDRDVQWNFEKYLVNRHGTVVKRIANGTSPTIPAS